jgi:hypothetical protein
MIPPILDERPLDLTVQGHSEQARRTVVQPTPAEDQPALQHDTVELTATPRCPSDGRELLRQPWPDDAERWRYAPR